jgi:hypothetical protein
MTIIQVHKNKVSVSEIRTNIEAFLTNKITANQEVFEALSRMGNHYGGSVLPIRQGINMVLSTSQKSGSSPFNLPSQKAGEEPTEPAYVKRYSVVYVLNEQYKQLSCSLLEQAREAMQLLLEDKERTPIGIYDDKTELFEWENSLRDEYEKASMMDQGRRGEEIINIAQALRRRDWDLGEFRRPSLFS